MRIDWQGSESEVKAAVKGVIDGCGLPARLIAERCRTTETTVSRWRRGRAVPASIAGREGLDELAEGVVSREDAKTPRKAKSGVAQRGGGAEKGNC